MSSDSAAAISSEIIIDAETGGLSIGVARVLSPHAVVPRAILPNQLTLRAIRDMRTGYVWHDFEGATFGGRPCILKLCALEESLEEIDIDFLRSVPAEPPWANPAEVSRHIALGRFILSGLLQRSFATGLERFPWGIAYSVYDDKSGGIPRIGLAYREPE
jgi:hypothetical protein